MLVFNLFSKSQHFSPATFITEKVISGKLFTDTQYTQHFNVLCTTQCRHLSVFYIGIHAPHNQPSIFWVTLIGCWFYSMYFLENLLPTAGQSLLSLIWLARHSCHVELRLDAILINCLTVLTHLHHGFIIATICSHLRDRF